MKKDNYRYIFKVRLHRSYFTEEHPFRWVDISSSISLYDFAGVIIELFDFQFDHCFEFSNKPPYSQGWSELYQYFVDVDDAEPTEGAKSVVKTMVNKVWKRNDIGKRMYFLFDYGDDWIFTVELRKVYKGKIDDFDDEYTVVKSKGNSPVQYE